MTVGSGYKLRLKAHIGAGAARLSITGSPVTAAQVGTAYAGFTVVASGGVSPYTYSVAPGSGSLPAGLTLNSSTGAVAGTPTTATTYSGIIIRVTDHNGNTADLGAFSVLVQAAGPPVPIVANQTLDFGALTLASAGATVPVNTGGVISANCAITGGTLNGTGWAINASSGALSKGTATISAGTLICTFGNDAGTQTGVVITINAVASSYSAATTAEAKAAAAAIGTASSGARSILLRTATYATDATWLKNRAYANTVTIKPHDGATATWASLDVYNSTKITLHGLNVTNGDFSTPLILIEHSSNLIVVENCILSGVYRDPNGDWHTGYTNPSQAISSGAPYVTNITIQNNTITDVRNGIVFADISGTLTITVNTVTRFYEDAYKFGATSGVTPPTVTVSNNVASQPISKGDDTTAPHSDFLQILTTALTADWSGITITGNHFFHGDSRGNAQQGIFNNIGVATYYISAPVITGNSCQVDTQSGIHLSAIKNGTIENNTITYINTGVVATPTIFLGDARSSGTISVQNNVSEAITLQGSATYTNTNNAVLGHLGVTIPYLTAFVGPTFTPQSEAEVLSQFAPKPAGPLDVSPYIGAFSP